VLLMHDMGLLWLTLHEELKLQGFGLMADRVSVEMV
jgi:hypothetical protein